MWHAWTIVNRFQKIVNGFDASPATTGGSMASALLAQLITGGFVTAQTRPALPLEDVLKALGDPVRLEIVRQMASSDEVACTTLEKTLHVTKPTISYHIKVLFHADLVAIRKEGRFYFYSLRKEALDAHIPGFAQHLAGMPVR